MKNLTLTVTLFSIILSYCVFAQTYSTGLMQFSTSQSLNYSAQIDVNTTSNLVTLKLVGPPDRYLGVGFGVNAMTVGGDCVIYDGVSLTNRTYVINHGVPSLDSSQPWLITSNLVNSGILTLIATRSRVSTTGDFTFPASAGPLQLVWSRGDVNGFVLQYHGSSFQSGIISKDAYLANLTLGNNEFEKQSFKLFPNPAKGLVSIEMPEVTTNGELKMYDALGRVVKKQTISEISTKLNISDLLTGTYLVVIRTDYGNSTKQLVIE